MVEQVDLFSSVSTGQSEQGFFECLSPYFSEVLRDANIPTDMLKLERKKGFSSIMLSTYLVARLCFRGKSNYIEIPLGCAKFIPEDFSSRLEYGKANFITILLDDNLSIAQHKDFFRDILNFSIDRLPKEFDCCSRYLECSDAKRCITPLQADGLGCGYKKILRSGRIFYGTNRNID